MFGTGDGIRVNFFGADYGKRNSNNQPFVPPGTADINHFLSIIDNVFRGTSGAFAGTAMMSE